MPLDPVTTSALISTGGSLVGGLLGKKAEKKASKKSYERQKEFAQNTIRWKAEDARRAGLHPLFAMGAGTANFSPSFMAGQDPMGSAISESARELGSAYAASKAPPPGTPAGPIGAATLREINSRADRNLAEAALAASQAKRAEAMANTTQDGNLYSAPMVDENRQPLKGKITPVAPEVKAAARGDRARQAGKSPLFQRYRYGPRPDQWLDVPFSDEGPLEEFGPGKAVATLIRYLQNRAKAAPLPRRRRRSSNKRRYRSRGR